MGRASGRRDLTFEDLGERGGRQCACDDGTGDGDAAEAEYSQGFLKMVTRALEKGWMVELVSFRHNISGMYKRKEFRAKWGTNFKIIELDDYVEELLGVQV